MEVEIIRSAKRLHTISASWEQGRLVVRMPAHLSQEQEAAYLKKLQAKMQHKLADRQQRNRSKDLQERAQNLNSLYFKGQLNYSIEWSNRQHKRWGSCTPDLKSLRISRILQQFPDYVLDYVIMHELCHLIQKDHSSKFWQLVNRYPLSAKARGFLEGWSFSRNLPIADDELNGDDQSE